jgi:polyisoprenoid-binding protein YceI
MAVKRVVIIGLAALIVVGGAGFWYLFLRNDAPEALSLQGAVADLTSTTAPGSGGTTAGEASSPDVPSTGDLDGTWTIDPAGTVVGYRMVEELASIGVNEAVGRTSDVTGTLTLTGALVDEVSVEVDMTTLESDSRQRDNAMRSRGLESGAFPIASFALSDPIDLGSVPASDVELSAIAVGDLTLHGVTRTVEIPVSATLVDAAIVVVGSVEVALADYGIDKPTGFSVVGIEDRGLLELQLAFRRS